METMKVSDLLEFTRKQCEERKGMYRDPIYVPVTMVVELDEQGRITRYSHPGMESILGKRFVDDTNWPFAKDEWVFHKTLKQVGRFIEVDQLDPSSATVEFIEDDGYKSEKRISLSLLTSEIPNEYRIVYTSKSGTDYTKEQIMILIRGWAVQYNVIEDLPESERRIIHEVVFRTLLLRLDGQDPATLLSEFDEEDVADIMKMFEKALMIAKWQYARLNFKDEDGTMNIEETAGYYLSEYAGNALQVFDDTMKMRDLEHESDKYLFWSRVREIILDYKDVH